MIWKVIDKAMIRADIKTYGELAQVSGIAPATLTQTRRKNPGSFKLYELSSLDKVLNFSNEEWLEIRGLQ